MFDFERLFEFIKPVFSLFENHIGPSCYLHFAFSFLDNGIVLKIITIYNQETESMEEVILEELQIFKVIKPQIVGRVCLCITNIPGL